MKLKILTNNVDRDGNSGGSTPARVGAWEETLTCSGRLSAIRSMTQLESDTGAYFNNYFELRMVDHVS